MRQLADKKGCTLGQLALSWVHHQGDDVFPIPGTKRIKYLEENIAAFNVKLSKQELAEIEEHVPHDQVRTLPPLLLSANSKAASYMLKTIGALIGRQSPP